MKIELLGFGNKKMVVKKIKKLVKKTAKKAIKKLALVNAENDKRFWVCDDQILSNLKDLAGALSRMSDETYRYHVNPEKNDFAKWVGEVLQDKILAAYLLEAESRQEAEKMVQDRLKVYA